MVSEVKWKGGVKGVVDRRVLKNGKTALFAAETWRRLYDPFVPMDTGLLAHDSVTVTSQGSTGYIHHKAPYAVFVYRGSRMAFSTTKHALASSGWDVAAHRAGRSSVLVRDVKAYIASGRG